MRFFLFIFYYLFFKIFRSLDAALFVIVDRVFARGVRGMFR